MAQVRQGLMNYDDVDRQKALYQERQSALGSLLQSPSKPKYFPCFTVVIVLPLITYTEVDYSPYTCMDMLHSINDNSSMATALGDIVTNAVNFMRVMITDIIYLNMYPYSSSVLVDQSSKKSDLRDIAIVTIELGTTMEALLTRRLCSIIRLLLRQAAMLNIGLTLFVGFMLLAATVVFNADVEHSHDPHRAYDEYA